MSEIPEGWYSVPLLNVSDMVRGVTYSKADVGTVDQEGYIGVIRANNIQDGQFDLSDVVYVPRRLVANAQYVKEGDVVIATSSGSISVVGKAAQATRDMNLGFGAFCGVLRPSSLLNQRYFGHYFSSEQYRRYVASVARGVNINNLKRSHFEELQIPLAPLPEQARIANKLDNLLSRVDSCRKRLDRLPEILRRFRQSVLAAATSGKLTEQWRIASNSTADWQQVALADVAADFSYGSSSKSLKVGRIPVLRMGNIKDGILDWRDLVYSVNENEIEKYKLEVGDVLFNRTNSPELVGKTAVYRGERPAIFAGYLIRVRCTDRLNPDYLNYCLNSPAGKEYCWKVKSDGVSQSNINAKKLAAFEFLLPTIQEQAAIVRRVELMSQFMDSLTSKLLSGKGKIDQLTPSVLAMAFRGELVATEAAIADSNDREYEDASALLQRINANRNEIEKSRKARPQKSDQPSSKNDEGKGKRMEKIDRETLLAAIIKLRKDQFTFDELRITVDANYEDLKATWFKLLQEPNAPIQQIFDDATKSIVFKRVGK